MSPTQPKVLIVLSSHSELGNTGKKTGWYLSEFSHPHEVLAPHASLTIASPAGGKAPLDPSSIDAAKDDKVSVSFLNSQQSLWENTHKLSEFLGKASEFDGLFFVGGHGPVFDLATDSTSHQVINEFYAANKVIAAVCHGPAALAYVKLPSGEYFLSGESVTGFANSEEDAVGLSSVVAFSLEDQLNVASGGKYVKGADWGEKVVVGRGGKLITGQNPASAKLVGEKILEGLKA